MHWAYHAGLVLIGMLAMESCTDESAANSLDGGTIADAASDGGTWRSEDGGAPMRPLDAGRDRFAVCGALSDRLAALSRESSCTGNESCVLFGDCGFADWAALNPADVPEASRIANEITATCGGSAEDGEIPEVACKGGRCVLVFEYDDGGELPWVCGAEEDAG